MLRALNPQQLIEAILVFGRILPAVERLRGAAPWAASPPPRCASSLLTLLEPELIAGRGFQARRRLRGEVGERRRRRGVVGAPW
jgi:hypothetical protein